MTYLLHEYLRKSAVIHAEKAAIVDGGRSITYGSLEYISSRLAEELRQKRIKRGELVGIYLLKSIEAIVAQFAVLKAALAYAPLDALHWPAKRILQVIAQGELKHIITTRVIWDSLVGKCDPADRRSLNEIQTIVVDDLMDHRPEEINPPIRSENVSELDLAYVLFTSGSTGTPKGVMISHRNALSFIEWAISYFAPPPGMRFASHASLNFDLSVFDVFVCIAAGGELHLVPPRMSANPRSLVRWVADEKIECWYSVPSVWSAVLKHARVQKEDLASLTKVLFAGEVFPPTQLARLMSLCPHADYYNLYGPTETNVCTCYSVQTVSTANPLPIGRPCNNYEVHVLNEALAEIADGEVGELMVYGPGVTRGYYRDPIKTAEAFIDSPFAFHHGGRLYRTGDLVRKSPDGLFVFVGRRDSMVKISGYRVELQDIEHTLCGHAAVLEAVAVAYEDDTGVRCLGAFIVPDASASDTPAGGHRLIMAMRKFVAGRLPQYMVPDVIFEIDRLPRSVNGKVERTECSRMFSSLLKRETSSASTGTSERDSR